MKLSTLVAYLNHLEQFDTSKARLAMAPHLEPVLHKVSTHDVQFRDFTQTLTEIRDSVQHSLIRFDDTIADLKQEILSNIENMEPHYLRESYKLYSENMVNDSNDLILSRRPNLTVDAENYVRARLMRHSDWHYPAMIIRPGLESWISDLVALDPMYLVDINRELTEPAASRFTPEYKGRLRRYVIRESTDGVMLKNLPQNQMALVLAYNYFNFKPLEMIRCFFQEIYHCLRPGGCLIFTFNNCDRSGGVELAERYFMCYTPGRLVLSAAEMIGFETIHVYDIDAAATWVELRRPGELNSLRGGQSLAKVITKPLEKRLDFANKKSYTEEDLSQIRHRAAEVGITRDDKFYKFSARELLDLILQKEAK